MGKTNQYTFARYEMKFLIPAAECEPFRREMEKVFQLDQYGLSKILNIYYDTGSFDLVSRSLKKPNYKEKLRLRSYGVPTADSPVFAELKKKVSGIVYKRRSEMTYREAERLLNRYAAPAAAVRGEMPGGAADRGRDGGLPLWEFPLPDTQINRELRYVTDFYHPEPKMVLCYDREAFFLRRDPEVRLTIDRNIRYRTEDLDLTHGDGGTVLDLGGGQLLELKVAGAMPADLSRMFARHRVYPVSFSKYGKIYETLYARGANVWPRTAACLTEQEILPRAAGWDNERRNRYVYQHT